MHKMYVHSSKIINSFCSYVNVVATPSVAMVCSELGIRNAHELPRGRTRRSAARQLVLLTWVIPNFLVPRELQSSRTALLYNDLARLKSEIPSVENILLSPQCNKTRTSSLSLNSRLQISQETTRNTGREPLRFALQPFPSFAASTHMPV